MALRSLDASGNTTGLGGNATGNPHCLPPSSAQAFDQISWVIGITLAILAAISNNLGVNFQKLAWTKKQNNEDQFRYRCIWMSGMVGIILASVFDFIALAFAPQSVIAPLGALTMVLNGCIAPVMHGEKLRRKIVWTTFIIVSGCAMAVATASHANLLCDLDGIFAFFASYTFLGYSLVICAIVLPLAMFIKRAENIAAVHGLDSKEYMKVFKYHRVSYAFLAGLFGAQSVVFARSIGQLVMSTTRGGQLFLARWETWLIIVALVAMIVVQMIYLNKGLERFESSYNVPVFTGTFIVGTAVSGGVVYGEFNNFSSLQAILFPLGVLLCVLGVFALAWSNDEDTGEVENDTVPEMPVVPPTTVSRPPSVTIPTPRHSSLRLHSGGFTPFVIGVHDTEPIFAQRPLTPRRTQYHHRDLLTGLRADEITPTGTIVGGRTAFFTRNSYDEMRMATLKSRTTGGEREFELNQPVTSPSQVVVSHPSIPSGTSLAAVHTAPSAPVHVDFRQPSPRVLPTSVDEDLLKPLSPKSQEANTSPRGHGFD